MFVIMEIAKHLISQCRAATTKSEINSSVQWNEVYLHRQCSFRGRQRRLLERASAQQQFRSKVQPDIGRLPLEFSPLRSPQRLNVSIITP